MRIEVRPCQTRAELEDHVKVPTYVFAGNDNTEIDRRLAAFPEEGPYDLLTLDCFVDGKVATAMVTWPFDIIIDGAPIPMAGISGVGTMPQHRRRGYLREVILAGFRAMKDRGQPLAGLWASMGAIYQRFGFGLATDYAEYLFNPRLMSFREAPPPTALTFDIAPTDPAMAPELVAMQQRWTNGRNLCLDVPEAMMSRYISRENKRTRFLASARDQDGALCAFATFTVGYPQPEFPNDGDPPQEMEVEIFAALDIHAERGLWELICSHDLVRRVKVYRAEPTGSLPLLLQEPRALQTHLADGVWLRLVDALEALRLRPYGGAGSLVLGIEGDGTCPWNNGAYLLEAGDGGARVTPTRRDPAITLGPAPLASLFAGYASATRLRDAGLLSAANDEAVAVADQLFRTRRAPYCQVGW